jgi:hypothetical protein
MRAGLERQVGDHEGWRGGQVGDNAGWTGGNSIGER